MNINDEALFRQLLETFKIEAREHIDEIGSGLIELEKSNQPEILEQNIESIYRAAHSLKGAARAVNRLDIERICQAFENTLDLIKKKEVSLSPQLFDLFHKVLETLEILLNNIDNPQEKGQLHQIERYVAILNNIRMYDGETESPEVGKESSEENEEVKDGGTLNKLQSIMVKFGEFKDEGENNANYDHSKSAGETQPLQKTEEETFSDEASADIKPQLPVRPSSETVRLSIQKISTLYPLAEEMLQIKLQQNHRLDEFSGIMNELSEIKKTWAKVYFEMARFRHDIEKYQTQDISPAYTNRIEKVFPDIDHINSKLKLLEKKGFGLQSYQKHDVVTTGSLIDNLLDEVKKMLMLPFSDLLDSLPRISRELARDLGKNVEVVTNGSEIEVDRRILEEIKDPVIHMIRNAIDHGIETPALRKTKNKPEQGKIEISIRQIDNNSVELSISDDGAGLDKNKILNKAFNQKIITKKQSESLTDEEIIRIAFNSGFSTSSLITDISGRGLGLAIVEERVEKLGGTISISTKPELGTNIVMILPTVISKYQGLIVEVSDQEFLIPVSNIVETLRVKKDNIASVKNRETIKNNGQTLSLVSLAEVLEIPVRNHNNNSNNQYLFVVVIESVGKSLAFKVDRIGAEQEVLVKSLEHPLKRIRNVTGASVNGAGRVIAVLNPQDLIKTAINGNFGSVLKDTSQVKEALEKKSILIAEDSITSRMFLKNVVEGAGYDVKTTVDGREALTALKEGQYDLLVSDIEMPRMNGFELTASIRADKSLKELPVILVTGLEKREHKEKGIEVGANAYIIKSTFAQSNLLNVIKQLI